MLEAILKGLGGVAGALWEMVAPYMGIFWFFVLVVLALLVVAGVVGYLLLVKEWRGEMDDHASSDGKGGPR